MRKLIAFMMLFSISSFAQDAEQYKYDPSESDNPAEYYIGSFNKGKDLEDLQKFGDLEDLADLVQHAKMSEISLRIFLEGSRGSVPS